MIQNCSCLEVNQRIKTYSIKECISVHILGAFEAWSLLECSALNTSYSNSTCRSIEWTINKKDLIFFTPYS